MQTEEHQAIIVCYNYFHIGLDDKEFLIIDWDLFLKYFKQPLGYLLYRNLYDYYNPKIHCNKSIDELILSLDEDNIKIATEIAKTLYKNDNI